MCNKKFRVIILLVALCIFLTSCSNTIITSEIITAEISDNSYHTASSDIEKIAQSDYAVLYLDKTTYTASIIDKNNNFHWTSLPQKSNSTAYAFELTLYTENGVYILNTQDNSVAFSSATYETGDNYVTVNYVLSDNAETASKQFDEIEKNEIYVSFSVTYSLNEQSLTTTINLEDMKLTNGAFISDISYLPYLGASYDDSVQDYFLVPDGSGAVMYTNSSDSKTDNISITVYGSDPYVNTIQNTASATIPVFGIKRNNNAFAAIITDGDALATINASRKNGDTPSKANAVFSITSVKKSDDGTVYFGDSYSGSLTVVYKFLSDSSADYSSMAAAAREEFISEGILPYQKYESDSSSIPFCVTIIGNLDKNTYTTTQQTLDIIDALKSKGIDNIQLNYKGLLSGGFAQTNLYSADILKASGGESGYSELYNYTQRQNYTLYTDINIFSSSKKTVNGTETIDGENAFYTLKNDLGFRNYNATRLSSRIGAETASVGASKRDSSIYSSIGEFPMYLTSADRIRNKLSAFLSDEIASICPDFSVNDAGYILASSDSINRQDARDIISSEIRTIANYGSLSVRGGNIYTVYAADYISDTYFDSYYPEKSGSYEPVPFYQCVVHGYLLYSGRPIDAADPLYRYDMLQYIEYGAMPSFEWVYDASSIFSYEGYLLAERISEITEFYKKANEALSDISDATIVSHKKITIDTDGKSITGVYRTEYSDGTEIYINYTGTAVVTPENIVVGAYDFVKIKR